MPCFASGTTGTADTLSASKMMNLKNFDTTLKLAGFEPSYNSERIKESTLSFLNKHLVPKTFVEFLSKYSFNQPVKIGRIYFDRVNDLEEHNLDEMNKVCIESNFLIVGIGQNGDPIVVNLNNLTVGYVFHDKLYEEDFEKLENILINMDMQIDEFYMGAVEKNGFPVDAYDAEKFINEKKNASR